MKDISESSDKSVALSRIESLCWHTTHGPDLGPDTLGQERGKYGEVVLEHCIRDALV